MIEIFLWPFLASMTVGVLLNLLGIQLASRDKTVQSLVMSQGALLGVLVGIAFAPEESELFPFASSVIGTAVLFILSERISESFASNKTAILIVLYTFLLAMGSILTALLPGVEVHLSQKFFGNLATLSDAQSKFAIVSSLIGISIFIYNMKTFTRQSFEIAVFAFKAKSSLFLNLEFLIISYSVMCFGLLFTVACLFTATTGKQIAGKKGLFRHHFVSTLITISACFLGFLGSVLNTRIPTVPAIVACLVLLCSVFPIVHSLKKISHNIRF
jgi:ABC-type Mn2+/Zn2+ transport system permease subunit